MSRQGLTIAVIAVFIGLLILGASPLPPLARYPLDELATGSEPPPPLPVQNLQLFERMRELGCDTIQGYLFGRPLSYERANQMVVGLGNQRKSA